MKKRPSLTIQGTTFLFDIDKLVLVEKLNPENVLHICKMRNHGTHYSFDYSVKNKSFHQSAAFGDFKATLQALAKSAKENDPPIHVIIPRIAELDPIGMCRKYACTIEELKTKADTEIITDNVIGPLEGKENQSIAAALQKRLYGGMLPTIHICDHPFYVDIRMGKLRPKDDFLSNGIYFSDIEDYYDPVGERYIIPYDPQKNEFRDIDYETITAIPKDLTVVSFPHEEKLDMVGWNRQYGFEPTDGLENNRLQLHFRAKPASWEDIFVPQKIAENLQVNQSADNNKRMKM